MVIMLVLRWWYGSGWHWVWQRSVVQRVQWCSETFSIPQLVKTWFSPFKQTYNRADKGSIDTRINALVDNFVSRIIGALARTVLIFTGLLFILAAFVSGVLFLLLWPFIPILPILAVIMTATGFSL